MKRQRIENHKKTRIAEKSRRQITRFIVALFLFSLLATCYSLLSCYAASWPCFKHDAQRTGYAKEEAYPPLSFGWKYNTFGEIIASPVVDGGLVYVSNRDGSVYAFVFDTGDVKWQVSCQGEIRASPCVKDGRLYQPCQDGSLYIFDSQKGTILGKYSTGGEDISSPVVEDGILYAGSAFPNKYLYALNVSDRNPRWQYELGPSGEYVHASPALENGILGFGANDGKFYKLDLEGNYKWSYKTMGGIRLSSPVLDKGILYAAPGDDDTRVYAFDLVNEKIVAGWPSDELSGESTYISSPVMGDGALYIGSGAETHRIFALDIENGDTLWSSVDLGQASTLGFASTPALANDVLYAGSASGELYYLSVSSGNVINKINLSNGEIVASPAVSNGWVFIATRGGHIFAYKANTITSISYPDNYGVISTKADVLGYTVDGQFDRYMLDYGPPYWTNIRTSTIPVDGDTITEWDISDLDDGIYSLRLTVETESEPSHLKEALNYINVDNPPLSPTGVKAEDVYFDDGGKIDISWNKSYDDGGGDNDVLGYKIYRSTYSGGCDYTKPLATLDKNIKTYRDTSATSEVTFYYVVRAFDQRNESQDSFEVSCASEMDGVFIKASEGGTISLPDGTEAIIEPNTLSNDAWIGIRVVNDERYSRSIKSSKYRGTSIVREFGIIPEDTSFSKWVTIKIPYQGQDITGLKEGNLRIVWWDEDKAKWKVVNTSEPHPKEKRVHCQVSHFSIYRIASFRPGGEIIRSEEVYAYPNPARGDKVYFKFRLYSEAYVMIDIYNVAGELIEHLEKGFGQEDAGLVHTISWDIENIASGVYIFRVEAKHGRSKKAVTKKVAVIH